MGLCTFTFTVPSCFYTFGMPSLSSILRLDSNAVCAINFRLASRWKQNQWNEELYWMIVSVILQMFHTYKTPRLKSVSTHLGKMQLHLILHLVIT